MLQELLDIAGDDWIILLMMDALTIQLPQIYWQPVKAYTANSISHCRTEFRLPNRKQYDGTKRATAFAYP